MRDLNAWVRDVVCRWEGDWERARVFDVLSLRDHDYHVEVIVRRDDGPAYDVVSEGEE